MRALARSFAGRFAGRRAFSLVELLSVMGVIALLTGISLPAVKGLNGSNALNSGARKLAGLMNVARSEAIARHTVVRFVVARDWPGKQDANLRKISLWAWNPEFERFLQLTPWEELPVGVIVEPTRPAYVESAAYAADDRAAVHGDCVLDAEFSKAAEFNAGSEVGPIYTRFIEFLPSGNARIPGGNARQAIFVATQGFANADGSLTYTARAEGRPGNWAQLNVDTLTGRVRVYQP